MAAHSPVFFLAGPIRGGGDWQRLMCVELQRLLPHTNFTVICPCRWERNHLLANSFISGEEGRFERQLLWERHYLELAGTESLPGCIIFWLPCESKEAPHPGPEPYAMDTRGELGEWRWRIKTNDARVVVGAEPEFLGLSQIKANFEAAIGKDFPIHATMHATARAAIRESYL